jgi:hypothetical protein
MSRTAGVAAQSYETAGAWTVDRAARALATACARRSRAVPEAVALTLAPERIVAHLTSPDEDAPPGWSVADDGRSWWIPLREVHGAPVDRGVAEPFPRLVSLGVNGSGRILLNLGAADGLISVEGDAGRAYGLVQAWASRLATSPWSAGVPVVVAETPGALNEPGGGVLILTRRPENRDLEYVTWLARERHRGWSVVVLGADDARWRLTVDASGKVETGLLDEPVRLRA